jgi:AraC-like DNA-binding protein
MEYREHAPSPDLACVIETIWTLTGSVADTSPQCVLPDGRPELVLHLGDHFERVDARSTQRQPRAIFAGQLTRPLALRPTGRISVVGVRFRPDGAAAVLRVPQRGLKDMSVDVGELVPDLGRGMRSIRDETVDALVAATLVQCAIRRRLAASRPDPRVRFAVQAIQRASGNVRVSRLAEATGLTRRHLERVFLDAVGISPKRLARVVRFQRAVRLLERGAPRRGAETALECGYADQAHFVREFRELAGCPPGEHLLRAAELTGFFVARQRA